MAQRNPGGEAAAGSIPPPARPARCAVCEINKAPFIQPFPIPEFQPRVPLSQGQLTRACHSGQKRGVRSPRGRGWLGPHWREGGGGAFVPLHPCPAPTPSGSQAPANENSLALVGLCNFSANLGFFMSKV